MSASPTSTKPATFEEIDSFWKSWVLELTQARDLPIQVIASLEDTSERAESDISTLSSLSAAPDAPHATDAVGIKNELVKLLAVLGHCASLQTNLNGVVTFYKHKLLQQDLPSLFERYNMITSEIAATFEALKEKKSLPKIIEDAAVTTLLEKHVATMQTIVDETMDYLSAIRGDFPRFFFVSNDELIHMIGTRDERGSISSLGARVFENLSHFGFSEGTNDILSMVSVHGDELKFKTPVKYNHKLSEFFQQIMNAQIESIHELILKAKQGYQESELNEWIFKYIGQVSLVVAELEWSAQVDTSLQSSNPNESLQELLKKYRQLHVGLIRLARQTWTIAQKNILSSAIISLSFLMDTISEMHSYESISTAQSYWAKCTRYVWDSEHERVQVRSGDVTLPYGYEFLGSEPSLVKQQATHSYQELLSKAVHTHTIGLLSGPAGSGKNETIKDFARFCGRSLITINMSEGVDHIMLGHYLKGAIQSGTWINFDELNRITEFTTIELTKQIGTIKAASEAGSKSTTFMGKLITIHPFTGTFATMNPGFKPESDPKTVMKELIIAHSVSIPEMSVLTEGMLHLSGFEEGKMLGQKMGQARTALLQFSRKDHYDFGMRSFKSVVTLAEKLRKDMPDQSEEVILAKAFDSVNRPRITEDGAEAYESLFQQLFAGVTIPQDSDIAALTDAVHEVLGQMNLKASPEFVTKVLQVHSAIQTRHGVALVGPSGSGKTSCYRVLEAAYNLLHGKGVVVKGAAPVDAFSLDPMSVSLGELFGSFDPSDSTWKDGIVPSTLRRFNASDRSGLKWLVFDGVCHYEWAEYLNTVLDDNRVLCLMNGDRIDVPANVKIFVEAENFQKASPATVSRFGCVYVPANLLK